MKEICKSLTPQKTVTFPKSFLGSENKIYIFLVAPGSPGKWPLALGMSGGAFFYPICLRKTLGSTMVKSQTGKYQDTHVLKWEQG